LTTCLDIASGDFAVLMGASGSGKSTLLNLIGAVDRPTSGRVFLGDVETSALDEGKLTQLRRTSMGFIFQFFHLIPTLNVFENIAFPLSLAKRPKREIAERVSEVLERIGLQHRTKHYPNRLSGGEDAARRHRPRNRAPPPLVLADEPTGNLDSTNGAKILDLIRELHQSMRPTIVMATHSTVAAGYGDYVIKSPMDACSGDRRALVLRPILREKIRTTLTILGIAVGVAVVVAIQLANQSALRAFRESVDAIAGRANFMIVPDTGTLDERMLLALRPLWNEGARFAPVIDVEGC
jgi:putative ABC transport system ATP-binding protein